MISIKSEREIELMRKAGMLVSEMHKFIKPYIKPGISTLELDRLCTTEKEKDALNIIKNQKDKIVEDIIQKSLYKVSGEKLYYNYYNFYGGYVGKSYFLDIIREKKINIEHQLIY